MSEQLFKRICRMLCHEPKMWRVKKWWAWSLRGADWRGTKAGDKIYWNGHTLFSSQRLKH